MALGRSAIRNVDGQTTISNTATRFRTTVSDILASVTKAALVDDMMQVRAGSTPILKFNFLLGAILPGPRLSKVVPYPQELRGFRPWRLAELSVADRHFQHHLPDLLVISPEGSSLKHDKPLVEVSRLRRGLDPQHAWEACRIHRGGVAPQFFVQFLSRTHADKADFNVLPRTKSRHLDQAPRQSRDLHRVSHVQHVDLPVRTKSCGLQHKLYRRRDGHEVARHLFMRDRHWTTGGDLAEKDRRDASTAAHHVSEPHARAPRSTSPL